MSVSLRKPGSKSYPSDGLEADGNVYKINGHVRRLDKID